MQFTSQTTGRAPAVAPRGAAWRRRLVEVDDGMVVTAFEAGRSDADAPALLLVHGLGHWTQAAWDFVAEQFEDTHRVVGFDLPGFGDSSKPDTAYTVQTFARALDAVVDAFALQRFALAGHSLGGLIAADFAARRPQNVRMLGLLDPVGFARSAKLALRIAGSRPAIKLLRSLRPSRRFVRQTFETGVFDPASIPESYHDRAYALSQDPALARAFAMVYAGAAHDFLRIRGLHARLARWRGPTLLVWGRHDRYVPLRGLAAARRVYPHAQHLVLQKCGHCPSIEFPVTVARALRAAGA